MTDIAGLEATQPAFAEVMRRQQEVVAAVVGPLIEGLERAAKAGPRVFPYLAERGWHATYSFPVLTFVRLDGLIQDGKDDEADEVMCALTRERLGLVEDEACKRFPDRESILRDALEAHRNGKYTLSIPALMAQADGIGCEVMGISRQFFKLKNRSHALQAKLSAMTFRGQSISPWGVRRTLLEPLSKESSLEVDTMKRDSLLRSGRYCCPLNRHGVQHGLDLDYPTEANSLRCVNLLEYLLDVDRILQRDHPDEVAALNRMWEEALSDPPPPTTPTETA
jgi:hypothetical protein